MTKRMTDERLAVIDQCGDLHDGQADAFSGELLQALKAERERIADLEADRTAIARIRDKKATESRRRIVKLEAQIEAVNRLPRYTIMHCIDYVPPNNEIVHADELDKALEQGDG